jgi:hypothetical protein
MDPSSRFTSQGDEPMRERMKALPQLESLESMTLLSGAAAAARSPHDHAEVSIATPAREVTSTLSGTEHGVFRVYGNGSGKTYDITAAGKLTPIGRTTIAGNLVGLSGISSGPPAGTLNLTTTTRTLTLQIPKSVAIPVGLPTATSKNEIVDTYVITGGTGAYEGDTGSGVVEFTFRGANSSPARSRGGRVDITFTTLLASPSSTPTS